MIKKKNTKTTENTANQTPTQPARSFLEQLKYEAKIQSIASSCRLAGGNLSDEAVKAMLEKIENEKKKK